MEIIKENNGLYNGNQMRIQKYFSWSEKIERELNNVNYSAKFHKLTESYVFYFDILKVITP